jgi:hypothetical protein
MSGQDQVKQQDRPGAVLEQSNGCVLEYTNENLDTLEDTKYDHFQTQLPRQNISTCRANLVQFTSQNLLKPPEYSILHKTLHTPSSPLHHQHHSPPRPLKANPWAH